MSIETQTRDLYMWWPLLAEIAAGAGQPHAPAGGAHTPDGSPIEQAIACRDEIRQLHRRLAAVAAEAHAAHSGEETPMPDAHPALVLHGLAAWIDRQPFARDIGREIDAIHSGVSRLVGYTADKADAACPSCRARGETDAPRLERAPTREGLPDLYACPRCGYAAVIEPAGPWNDEQGMNTLALTWQARVQEALEASTDWVEPRVAARMTGVRTGTIRVWKHRGQVAQDAEGRVMLGEIARKARTARN